jgi:hypothetical protein
VEDRHVIQIQVIKTRGALRPLWSSPSSDTSNRNDGDIVSLDIYTLGSIFISLPMLTKGQQKMFEETMAKNNTESNSTTNKDMKSASSNDKETLNTLASAAVKAAVAEVESEVTKTTSENNGNNINEDGKSKVIKKKGPLIQDVTEVDELD